MIVEHFKVLLIPDLQFQNIYKDNEFISTADIHLVAVNKNGKPTKLPVELKNKLEN